MNFKEYSEKYKILLEPIDEIPVKIGVLGVIESIAEEYGGDFQEEIFALTKDERKRLLNTEIAETTVKSEVKK